MRFRFSPAFSTLLYAALAAVWIVASATVLDFTVTDPVLQGRIEIAKGLAFVALSSAMLYLLLRARRADSASPLPESAGSVRESGWKPLLALFAILGLMVPLTWFAVFSLNAKQVEKNAREELRIIAAFKAREIERWLAERRGDAQTLAGNTGFVEWVGAFLRNGSEAERVRIVDQLSALQATFAYHGVTLLAPDGRTLLKIGEPIDPPGSDRDLARNALAAGSVQVGELYRDVAGRAHLYVTAPITLKGSNEPIAVAVLHVDPYLFLYPLVSEWPAASPSGEALLVRRDGDSVLYLNELRQRADTALKLRSPLSGSRLPAAIALNSSRAGTTSGIDYRGVPVLAAWSPVAGTAWVLLAKIDRDEALLAARGTANWTTSAAAFALALVLIAVALLFRQQRIARDLALQAQSNRLTAQFYELPFIGMGISAGASKQWLQVNGKLCEMLGYTHAELVGKSWPDMTHPDDLEESLAAFDKVTRGEQDGYLIEKRYLRKDGSILHVRLDARCVRAPDGSILSMVSTIEDITARRHAEAKTRDLTRLYSTLSRSNAAIIRTSSESQLLAEVCRIAVEYGGMRMSWAGLVEPGGTRVKPVASAGAGIEYLADLHISVDPEEPQGRGPSGVSIREDRPVWCQDFAHDPRTGPWHELGLRYGWGGSASLPLRRGGKPVGCLTFYPAHVQAFDAETQALLTEIADDVSYGLDALALDARRQAAAAALAESEERYRLLFDNSQDGILLTDPSGRVLTANAAACRIFGRTREALLAAPRGELVDADDPRVAAAVVERERQGYFTGTMNLRRGNGDIFPAEVSSTAFHTPQGEVRAAMIVRDISEKQRNEAALAESEKQFSSLAEQTVAGLYIVQDGRMAYVNRRYAEILGYGSPEELVGREALSLVAEKDRALAQGNIRRRMEGTVQSVYYEISLIRKDGSTVEIGAHGTAATYKGRPAIVGLLLDITEKQRAERQAERYLAQLKSALVHTVEVATTLSEMRDPYTAGHEKRVAQIAVGIATELGYDEERLEGLQIAGYLHDIGKITIPSEILSKPGKLTAAEYALIKGHAQASYDVLKNVDFPWPIADMVLQHHERIDGTGYPQGLKGDAILPEARILAVADVVEAMSSHRPYRPGLGIDRALEEIARGRGTAYDPVVADACLKIFREKGFRLPD